MNILVVDDNKCIRDVIGAIILANHHQPIVADGYVAALDNLRQLPIDVILMDIEMPEVDGFTLTRMVREEFSQWIPIIFLSATDSDASITDGIDAGGDDYLTKPVKEVILNAKIKAMARIAKMKTQLDEANKKLEMLSCLDPLTEVVNRRGLEKMLQCAWKVNLEENTELSLLMIDIDFFKSYNDHYGHPRGDDCLKRVAAVMTNCLYQDVDLLARYGGEEFIIVLPGTSIIKAISFSQDIIIALHRAGLPHQYSLVADIITVSIGVSCTCFKARNYHELITQADCALYQAKRKGRMQSVVFEGS